MVGPQCSSDIKGQTQYLQSIVNVETDNAHVSRFLHSKARYQLRQEHLLSRSKKIEDEAFTSYFITKQIHSCYHNFHNRSMMFVSETDP